MFNHSTALRFSSSDLPATCSCMSHALYFVTYMLHCVFMAPFTLLFVDYDGSGAAENRWSELPPPPWPCTNYSDDKANHALCLLVFKRMFSTVTVPLQLGLMLAQQFKIAWSYNSCKYTIKINVKYTQSWWEIIMELKNHSKVIIMSYQVERVCGKQW